MRKKIAIPGETASPLEQARNYVVDTGLYLTSYIKLIGKDAKLDSAIAKINEAVTLVNNHINEIAKDKTP